eukprot:TRINITY_DN77_c0_g1_i4.p1 TRINITY_DN77_c0_g1~~TRINITY_DN77_c0_g1_i4.p1  ORF type:complete len:542 (+),score=264.95 TRINITY_DN77_c0_g1_i4:50-1675(+)
MKTSLLSLLALAGAAHGAAPMCSSIGKADMCTQFACESTCRGYPPGFGTAGCVDATNCANPPAWAASSVCQCSSAPPGPAPTPSPRPAGGGVVGGYLLLKNIGQLQALAANSETIPFTRVYLAFLSPTLQYVAGSKTLKNTGLDDFEFEAVQKAVGALTKGGVEVFLSMGGWNAGCNPYFYARYSVGGYGTHTPNYWEIEQYGGGDLNNCVESNQFCYVCEPPSENTTLASFDMFPTPAGHATWEQAKAYVQGKSPSPAPAWNEDMVPGGKYTDSKTGVTVTLPGRPLAAGRNPYQDFVQLAKELGVSGIDLDYEEMWHADYFKVEAPMKGQKPATGDYKGPWKLPQTVYKYAAIAKDLQLNIAAIAPGMKLGTASAAVGAWGGSWWGGNLKGLWFELKQTFPEVLEGMDLNVMTYDLSSNEEFHECPDKDHCPLADQVDFFMSTYTKANMGNAFVGYEIGQPAYPSPVHDKQNQLPLTKTALATIIEKTQNNFPFGGFLWEIFKPAVDASQATPQDVAQAICNSVRPGDKRCTGTIPQLY